ncbi:DNA cytosine methyltransferase [Paenibacillus bovis]|uniref:DNA (cytosine-5-)-methyltransferase n=1 Tax=Paenibacillus bovis TaxID=1616788 RepID=A0A1X9T496_9BACL|nr:DNA cytosine methyltransferase [Paenibacillus bovis]ARR10662.1 C-5 cytosine-specific DNA methylase [Paenibacillus bovis]
MAPFKVNTQKTIALLFGGIGGATLGYMSSRVEYGGHIHSFNVLCSIDSDPVACMNHDLITGEPTSVCMDLFKRWQYTAWHGCAPPPEWQEVTPADLWKAFQYQVPDFLFSSPPCKGLSGLLPNEKAKSDKYQALNYLTVHGLELALRACDEYGGKVPGVIQLENVPRITTRGASLLKQIKKLLIKYGYAVSIRPDHNLGEIGGLGQNRVRFLIMARHETQVPNFIEYPEKKPLRSIGDVLKDLPYPGDVGAGGPLHRLSKLQFKTWMRLALIPAGGDWRDLQTVDYQNLRVMHEPRRGAFEVAAWENTSRTVTSSSGPGQSNGVTSVADPRSQHEDHLPVFRVQPAGGAGDLQSADIANPNLSERSSRHAATYRIVRMHEPAPCVTGTRFGSGALAIADMRVNTKLMPDSYGVQDWEETAKTVRSANRTMQAAAAVADPCIKDRPGRYTDKFRMQDAGLPAATVTGVTDVQSGAQLIADPALGNSPRSGTFGVQDWQETGKTVTGSADVHASAAAIADPRPIPQDTDRGVYMIIAEDGTWHRPLTTYELAMLQCFPAHLPDGRPFQLIGCADAKAREYIGNAVPKDSAMEMGNVVLLALAQAEAGDHFSMSWNEVWVAPEENQPEAMVH